ncbi:sensor histidine kinase [Hwangdonia lutea]|uniref:Histidine kinase n=1 Tax=Hwangdonia lutea TaxID=3075823 RepID=A0AA97HRX4_9FLAO|nr:histidine kinase [Hwangdonia sp. SCSIO 19198]WOD45122.1 histidine kinase [Hwangdonia sp. SCSIO 19198]
MSIQQELLKTMFLTENMKEFFSEFPVQAFNDINNLDYGFIGKFDKFLLQKVYADDFISQFEDYLYTHYPWQYAYSFLSKEKMKMLAISIVTALGIIVFILLFSFFQNRKFKHAYLSYLFPIVLIALHIINLKWIYEYLTILNSPITWSGSIIFGFLFIGILAIISATLLYFLEKIFLKLRFNFSFQLLLKVVFTFAAFNLPLLVFIFLVDSNIKPDNLDFLESYFPWFIISIFLALGRGLLIYLNHISQSLVNEKDVELSRLKEANTQSELKLLQSHINPHFLYNALNSIAGLAYKSAEKTEKMALSLSNLFRYSINKKGQQMSTVKDEVLMVQNYLEIEKIRFGERLKFILEVDKTLENEAIPMYILQPLVENAIKHGVSQVRGEGLIVLEIKQEDDNLLIRVIDNGPDFSTGLVSGHGLQTVYDLLRLSYGDKATLHWENAPVKHISISIPKLYQNAKNIQNHYY